MSNPPGSAPSVSFFPSESNGAVNGSSNGYVDTASKAGDNTALLHEILEQQKVIISRLSKIENMLENSNSSGSLNTSQPIRRPMRTSIESPFNMLGQRTQIDLTSEERGENPPKRQRLSNSMAFSPFDYPDEAFPTFNLAQPPSIIRSPSPARPPKLIWKIRCKTLHPEFFKLETLLLDNNSPLVDLKTISLELDGPSVDNINILIGIKREITKLFDVSPLDFHISKINIQNGQVITGINSNKDNVLHSVSSGSEILVYPNEDEHFNIRVISQGTTTKNITVSVSESDLIWELKHNCK